MSTKQKPYNYWTLERCKEEALGYETRTEFQKQSKSAYQKSLKNNWLDKICDHMKDLQKPRGYWTFEKCKEEALKYRTKKELKKTNGSVYNIAHKNNWIVDICSHMEEIKKPNGYWTFERCKEEALKYKTRTEFQSTSVRAYQKSLKNNWLDNICSHMKENKKPPNYWTFEKCKEEALKYDSRCEFSKRSQSAYNKGLEYNWIDEICQHMVQLHKPNNYWTFERCKEEALKYKTRTEFQKHSTVSYHKSLKNNWLDDICQHMDEIQKPRGYWTFEKCQEEALRYETRGDFYLYGSTAYVVSNMNGWADKICEHMHYVVGTSKSEEQLFELIKEKYPTAKKLRKRNINIPDKPHIYGFDIDIYIPELRKGIEFDGDYWHSFEGLKKTKPNWKEEDLKKYHTIKDNYFKSQGIEIIHIKESDWNNNQEEQIQRCLNFLQ